MPSPTNSRREEWQEGIALVLALPLVAAIAFLVLGCFRLFTVPSGSMLPTYGVGSYIVVSRLETGFNKYTFDLFPLPLSGSWPKRNVQRGEAIVFRLPADHKTFYIKRIIAMPGDTIALHAGRVVINGAIVPRIEAGTIAVPNAMDEDVSAKAYTEMLPDSMPHTIIEALGDSGPWDETAGYTVPQDHVFVMGDNRDNSSDSRQEIGMVPMEMINGKVVANFRVPWLPQD